MAYDPTIYPLPDLSPKGSHGHDVPSPWNPLKERSIVITDHNTGNKSGIQIERVQLPEGIVPLIKDRGRII